MGFGQPRPDELTVYYTETIKETLPRKAAQQMVIGIKHRAPYLGAPFSHR